MPPNTTSGTILDKFGYSYKQLANPYNETKHVCFEECPGTSGSGSRKEHEAPEPSVDDTVRVTTRARLTYELYNYSKNAMLIVNSTINAFESDIKIKELETTFAKFRFEVEVVNIGLNNVELYEKCEQFLQRDFTDYGAVALVILSAMAIKQYPVKGFEWRFFEETVITDNFKLERNPTLVDKPKIYITEIVAHEHGCLHSPSASCKYASLDIVREHTYLGLKIDQKFNWGPHVDYVGRGYFTLLDKYLNYLKIEPETHGDVIGFHWRARDNVVVSMKLDEKRSRRSVEIGPLVRFCKKLAAMGDNVALSEIIAQTKSDDIDFHREFISPNNLVDRIGVVDTLSKALYFAKTDDNLI